jgi:hypothetical protein
MADDKQTSAWEAGEAFLKASFGAPVEPSADMRGASKAMFEMFTALKGEGFTENQALRLIAYFLRAGTEGNDDGRD